MSVFLYCITSLLVNYGISITQFPKTLSETPFLLHEQFHQAVHKLRSDFPPRIIHYRDVVFSVSAQKHLMDVIFHSIVLFVDTEIYSSQLHLYTSLSSG